MTDFDELRQDIATHDFLRDLVNLIDNGKVLIHNAIEISTSATKNILDWCDSTTPFLNQLINNNDGSKSQVRESLSAPTLNDSSQEIRKIISNLDNLVADIVSALVRIAADFESKTNDFRDANRESYENLEIKFQNLKTDIFDLKLQLRYEAHNIYDLQIQSGNAKDVLDLEKRPEFYEDILESMIVECNRYHKRHGMNDVCLSFTIISFHFQRQ